MKFALSILLILILLIPGISVQAEQVNYTSLITSWAQKAYPGQTPTFIVKEVVDLGVESDGTPTGELAMWVVVSVKDDTVHHILILNQKGVKASKTFDPTKAPTENESEEGPSCSPEEHERHHGKQTSYIGGWDK